MKTSRHGLDLLTKREGLKTTAYKDSVGVWTIGIGHTSAAGPPKVTPGLVLSKQQCLDLLAKDIVQYEKAVNDAVKVKMEQHEFDALVSFCYNIGAGGLRRSTVVKRLNAGDRKGAAQAFMLWNKPKDIIGRRAGEMKQFQTPYLDLTKETITSGGIAGAGGVAASVTPIEYWPYIAIGTVIALVLGLITVRWYKNRKKNNAKEI